MIALFEERDDSSHLILSGTVPVEKDTLNIISKPFDVSDNAPFNPGMGLTSIIMKAGGGLHKFT